MNKYSYEELRDAAARNFQEELEAYRRKELIGVETAFIAGCEWQAKHSNVDILLKTLEEIVKMSSKYALSYESELAANTLNEYYKKSTGVVK